MNLLEKIINCQSDEEVDKIITEAINKANTNSIQIEQLGFLEYGQSHSVFKGFIPLNTRIKYMNFAIETYGMESTDFFYEFAHFIRKYNINNKASLIHNLEYYINNYFGYPSKIRREQIFNDIAWNKTKTDEEYFKALEQNKLGDLKGTGAAECTEKSALAQQILSLFDIETYYCIGCIDIGDRQESHCFNIVKRKNDYALLDYSMPITSYKKDGSIKAYYPFVGQMTNEEFNIFITSGSLKIFDNYKYINDNQKINIDGKRIYVIGKYQIKKEDTIKINR